MNKSAVNILAIKPKVRCVIYARTSTEEGLESEFNSLDAQELACTKYIDIHEYESGYTLCGSYIDGGFSGGNTERPELKRLIADITAELVDLVVVYKIDRLSRSMLDFLNLLRMFEQYNVAFVSVTQQFNTGTSAGKLMLNIMMSFGEYEREITRERTLDKIASSKQRGMWMGGHAPLGYNIVDKKLVINELEAETVRFIFTEFIKKRSLKQVVYKLNDVGIRSKLHKCKEDKSLGGREFDTGYIHRIINNPIYVGKIHHKGELYKSQHVAIISDDIWADSRKTLQIAPKVRAGITKRKVSAVLMGLLKCGGCGCSMTPTHTRKKNGKVYRYYTPSAHNKGKCTSCPIKQVSAPEIESIVLAQLHQMFQTPELLAATWKSVSQEMDCKVQISKGDMNKGDANKTIAGKCNYNTLATASMSEEQIRNSLQNINSVWQELFPIEQERLLKLMLDKVIVQENSIELRIKTDGLLHVMHEANSMRLDSKSGGSIRAGVQA